MDNQVPYDEREWLNRLAKGDHAAFNELFHRWYDMVYSSALIFSKSAELARDTTQEVFLELWKQREKMDEVDHPKTYLVTIARNMIYRRLSRVNLETAYRNYLSGHLYQVEGEDEVQAKQLSGFLEDGIRLLPPQQQRAFRLSREQGLSHEAIAAEMQVSRQSVKDYIVRAIAFLRRYLVQCGYRLFVILAACLGN